MSIKFFVGADAMALDVRIILELGGGKADGGQEMLSLVGAGQVGADESDRMGCVLLGDGPVQLREQRLEFEAICPGLVVGGWL